MAAKSTKATPVKTDEPKKERKTTTPEERIAQAEANLAALREKAAAKKEKASEAKRAQRAVLRSRRFELDQKIDALTAEIGDETEGSEDEQLSIDDITPDTD